MYSLPVRIRYKYTLQDQSHDRREIDSVSFLIL